MGPAPSSAASAKGDRAALDEPLLRVVRLRAVALVELGENLRRLAPRQKLQRRFAGALADSRLELVTRDAVTSARILDRRKLTVRYSIGHRDRWWMRSVRPLGMRR